MEENRRKLRIGEKKSVMRSGRNAEPERRKMRSAEPEKMRMIGRGREESEMMIEIVESGIEIGIGHGCGIAIRVNVNVTMTDIVTRTIGIIIIEIMIAAVEITHPILMMVGGARFVSFSFWNNVT